MNIENQEIYKNFKKIIITVILMLFLILIIKENTNEHEINMILKFNHGINKSIIDFDDGIKINISNPYSYLNNKTKNFLKELVLNATKDCRYNLTNVYK